MSEDRLPEGYEVPIHRSMVAPLFWMGVPRNLFLGNVFLAILCGAIFKTLIIVPLAIAIHFLCKYLGQKDPQFHLVFFRARAHRKYYYR